MSKKYDDEFEPFDFKDLDEIIERMFRNINKLPNLGDMNPKTHHHSVKLRFGTGMDKPEVFIDGKKVENESINDVFKNLGMNPNDIPDHENMLNSTRNLPEIDVKNISLSETPVIQYKETYFEIDKGKNSLLVTIELPGIEIEQITVTYVGQTVTIIGENDTSYKAEFDVDFEIDDDKIEITGNNSIYQIRLSN